MKILGVFIVCFVSSIVCGLSANAFRNDSLLQFSTSNQSFILFVNTITHTYNSYNIDTAKPTVSATQFILHSPTLFGNLLLRRLANELRYSKWLALSYSILVIITLITQSV